MMSNKEEQFTIFSKEISESLAGKRELVISGKVPPLLYTAVKKAIDGHHYKTLNDIVEEAILEKIIKIEWDKVKNAGE